MIMFQTPAQPAVMKALEVSYEGAILHYPPVASAN
jgi:hypothetical protein